MKAWLYSYFCGIILILLSSKITGSANIISLLSSLIIGIKFPYIISPKPVLYLENGSLEVLSYVSDYW